MNHRRANVWDRGSADGYRESARLRFRRAIVMCLLSVIAPGSPQLLQGNVWIGRIAFAAWCMLLGAVGYLAAQIRVDRREVLDLVTDPDILHIVRIGIIAVAVVWIALLIDAWRLAAPLRLSVGRGALIAVVNIALIAGIGVTAVYGTRLVHAERDVVTSVFHAEETSNPLHGRYNIALLGSDSGKGRTGIRPDSVMVASVDADTGHTVLIGLPRNLENVPFDDDSPMHDEYPNGFNCGSDCLLNAIHTKAEDRSDLYPDSDDPGMDATIDAISAVTDLKINYHIVINMKGMRDLVDALGGVTVNVQTRIAMFGREDAWKDEYIDSGRQTLDGGKALWYARSRVQADDYLRMARQKCLMSNMLEQLSPRRVVTHASDIADSSKALLRTDIPGKELGQFADLALKARDTDISTVSLVPPDVTVGNPDYDKIHRMIDKAINGRQTTPTEQTPSQPNDGESSEPSPGDEKRKANETNDLTSVC